MSTSGLSVRIRGKFLVYIVFHNLLFATVRAKATPLSNEVHIRNSNVSSGIPIVKLFLHNRVMWTVD